MANDVLGKQETQTQVPTDAGRCTHAHPGCVGHQVCNWLPGGLHSCFRASRENTTCPHLDLKLRTPRTVREEIHVVLSH